MLTHHFQDPNGEAILLNPNGTPASAFLQAKYLLNGKRLGDLIEDSYTSERQRQSKLEKMEMEINRIMERNNGQLFIVKHERNWGGRGNGDGTGRSADQYSQGDDLSQYDNGYEKFFRAAAAAAAYNIRSRPIFRIKFKPRLKC
jgi:hypothetical protein